jgi:hypothetical protein
VNEKSPNLLKKIGASSHSGKTSNMRDRLPAKVLRHFIPAGLLAYSRSSLSSHPDYIGTVTSIAEVPSFSSRDERIEITVAGQLPNIRSMRVTEFPFHPDTYDVYIRAPKRFMQRTTFIEYNL